MCAILQLVSAPLNPIPIAEHFRRSHPQCRRNYAESKESCAALLYTGLPFVAASLFNILRSVRTELCQSIVHSFCTQFTFHIGWFQLKREISRTITICLQHLNLRKNTRLQL